MRFRSWMIGFIFSIAASAQAQEIHEFYTGVREMGMGGAYTAVVNDETAVLLNPAALGKVRDKTVTLVDPELSGSLNDTKILDISKYSKAFNPQDVLDAMKAKSLNDTHYNAMAQVFPSFVLPNFGIGLNAKYRLDSQIDPTGTNYSVNYDSDYALATAFNFRFFGGIVKFGLGAKLIDRTELIGTYPTSTTNISIAGMASEGMGLSTDAGLILTAPVTYLPSLAAVVHDIGDTSFSISDGLFHNVNGRRPVREDQTIDSGISISPILGKVTRAQFTAEVHDITTLSKETDFMRRFHAGMELNFADFLFLRGGINQRYWTGGVEFSTEAFQLQAASYGEEIGTPTAHKEDRRWVGKFAIRF